MRKGDATNKHLEEIYEKYQIAVAAARSLAGDANKAQRGAQVGIARRYLNEIRAMLKVNPNFSFMYPFDDVWFEEQERMLRALMK